MISARTRHRISHTAGVSILVLSLFVTLLTATALLPWLTGREPAFAVLRAREREREATPELLESIRTEFGLPASPWESIHQWFSGLVRLDFGHSWVNPAQDAFSVATNGLGITAALTAAAMAFSLVLSVLIVVPHVVLKVAAQQQSSFAASLLAVLAALPDFVVAVLLLWWFAVEIPAFPVGGWATPSHMVLPTLALGIAAAGMYGRVLLIAADAECEEPWVEAWRGNGVPTRTIIRYITARAFIPSASQLTLFFAGTLSATAAIEVTFNIPGFGRTVVDSATEGDIPILQVAVTVVLGIGVMCGFITHLFRRSVTALLHGDSVGAVIGSGTGVGLLHSPLLGRVAVALCAVPLFFIVMGLPRSAEIVSHRRFTEPSWAYPLGTDQLGRDIWARLADGMGYTIGAAIAVTFACALIALIVGHVGQWVEHVGNAMNAVPSILLGLVLAAVFGRSMLVAAIAVLLVGWIPLAAHCASVAHEAAVSGHYRYAATMGASRWHLLVHHVFPITVPAVIRHAIVRIAHNAIALAALGYLGVGASIGSPDWGVLLNEATHYLERAPWLAFGPMLGLISLAVTSTMITDRFVAKR